MQMIWILIALFTVDGQTYEERLSVHPSAIECLNASNKLGEIEGVEYVCSGEYKTGRYSSQPSWMSNEQAEKLRK